MSLFFFLIIVPVIKFVSVSSNPYDCSFEYQKVEDPFTEIARKHVFYNASNKTVEIELNQDLINSILKDNFDSLGVNLPSNISIKDIIFNTKDQRLYINAKVMGFNIPISAKMKVDLPEDGIKLSGSDINFGNKKAPRYIRNQVPTETFNFSLNYADLGVPQVFKISNIDYLTGAIKVHVELDSEKIAQLALEYRTDMMNEIDDFKSEQSVLVENFIDKLLETEILSEEKIAEYVDQILANEEVVNSAIFFATADLNKYTEGFQKGTDKVLEWSEPIRSIKIHDTVEETVESILANNELKETLSWIVPEEKIGEYSSKAEHYYGMYKNLSQSIVVYDDIEKTVESILYNNDLTEALSLVVDGEMVDNYTNQARKYYSMYKNISTDIRVYDTVEETIDHVLYNADLKEALSIFVAEDTVNNYYDKADHIYGIYKDLSKEMGIYDTVERTVERNLDAVIYNDEVRELLGWFVPEDVLGDYYYGVNHIYGMSKNLYNNMGPYDTLEKTVEKNLDTVIYNDEVKELLGWFIPGEILNDYYYKVEHVYSMSKDLYNEMGPYDSIEQTVEKNLDAIIYNDDLQESATWFVPEEIVDEYAHLAQVYYNDAKVIYNKSKEAAENVAEQVDYMAESIDMNLVHEYADLIVVMASEAENTKQFFAQEVSRINAEDIEQVMDYIEDDRGIAGEYISSIDPYYYDSFRFYLGDLNYVKTYVINTMDSVSLEGLDEYNYVVEEIESFLELLSQKDYVGAIEMISASQIADNLAQIAEYYI